MEGLARLRVAAKTYWGQYRERTCVYSEISLSEAELLEKPKCPWQIGWSCDHCQGQPGYTALSRKSPCEALAEVEF